MSEWCKTWRLILSGIFMYHKGDWSLSLLRAEFRLTSGGHSYILVRLIAFLEDQIIVHSSNCLWCRKPLLAPKERRGELSCGRCRREEEKNTSELWTCSHVWWDSGIFYVLRGHREFWRLPEPSGEELSQSQHRD